MDPRFNPGTFVALVAAERNGQKFWLVRVEVVGEDGSPSNAWNEGEFAWNAKRAAYEFASMRADKLQARLFVEFLPPFGDPQTPQFI